MKRLKFYTVCMLVVAVIAAIVYLRYFAPAEPIVHRTVDPPAILQQIQALKELVTVKYTIQKVIGLQEETGPFSKESVLMMVQATVLGGVDLAELKVDDVKVDAEKRITIKLPPPKVMHVFPNEKETKVWDRAKTWWTPWVTTDKDLEKKARLTALEAVQAAALEMGILRDAQQNAEKSIREFLRAVGIASVTFETSSTAPAGATH